MNPTSSQTTRALICRDLMTLKFRIKKFGKINCTAAMIPTSTWTRNRTTAKV